MTREEHEQHLRLTLQVFRKHQLYANCNKCEFWLTSVTLLGHVLFMEGFSSIAASPTTLTKKKTKFEWTDSYEKCFQEIKDGLTSTPGGYVIAYASTQLIVNEKNYPTHDLELDAVFLQ
ncbi:uncharacterized protein [Solanum lycopersicum]|uniref:uncharacterized protein n=1 Tax=Solanum lycopersicum TaxID=4081 RepID=UPI0002BC8279|nr:uncharacterized protein LOC101243685 [Solanum lycopersicum]